MTDKEIKRHLRDASLYLGEAAKQWPRYKDISATNMKAGLNMIDMVWDYVDRPMGEKECECDTNGCDCGC